MAARRASTRLSGGEQELGKSVNGNANASVKRKSVAANREADDGVGEPAAKKRKQPVSG